MNPASGGRRVALCQTELTPGDVDVDAPAREPVADPTLGIDVPTAVDGIPRHRLVVIGDSPSHGLKSLAVSDAELSYPAMIAAALGWQDFKASS